MGDEMTGLATALLAFAGASVAQLTSHLLSIYRREFEEKQKAISFMHSLVAEIDHANKMLSVILAFLEPIDAHSTGYRFDGDPMIVQFEPTLMSKYDYSIRVLPETIYRVRYFFSQVKPLCDNVNRPTEVHFTQAGHRVLVGFLRYGLSLSVRLRRSIQSQSINEELGVSDQELVEYFRRFKFVGGGSYLTECDLADLFKLYPELAA